jgi:hypothetical protein
VFAPDGHAVVTLGPSTSYVWPLPPPRDGDAARLERWAEGVTGLELVTGDVVRLLDARNWAARESAP